MKVLSKKIAIATILFVCLFNITFAQSPTDTDTKIFCTGGSISLPALTNANYTVLYNSTNTIIGATAATFANDVISSLTTGYYFVMTKGTAAGSCISDAQIIPVYVLKPLTVSFTGSDYCSENVTSATLSGSVTNPESSNPDISLVYQWYTVDGATETKITDATTINYTATLTNNTTADISTVYRLKAGYSISNKTYCSVTEDKTIKVLAPATTPTITVTSSEEIW